MFIRDGDEDDVQFDADSFMDTVGSLLGEHREPREPEHARELATPETSGKLSTSVRRKDTWDRLGNFRELYIIG